MTTNSPETTNTNTAMTDRHTTGHGEREAFDPSRLPADVERIDISSPEFREHAFERYAEIRSRCPVTRAYVTNEDSVQTENGVLNRPIWITVNYEDASRALLSRDITVDATSVMSAEQLAQMPEVSEVFKPLQKNILNVDPPEHTRLRKLAQPSFTASAIERLRPRIQQITDELLDDAEAAASARGETAPNRTMELISQFTYPLPVTVICEMLGIPPEDREQTRLWSEQLLKPQTPEGIEQLEKDLAAFVAYLRELFAKKREQRGDDLISQLLQVEVDGDRMTEDEILAMVFILFVAGHITTVNLIANGVYALLTNPEQAERLRADFSLAPNAVEEMLRYYGPAETTTLRYVRNDTTLGGENLSRGEILVAVLAAANHDSARFRDPEVFDITRDDANRHVAFGKGIHACLGAPLARLEAQIAIETLFRRYPALRLGSPANEITWEPSFLRGLTELPLRF